MNCSSIWDAIIAFNREHHDAVKPFHTMQAPVASIMLLVDVLILVDTAPTANHGKTEEFVQLVD